MFLRFPWLLSRRRLLAALLIDSLLFAAILTAIFQFGFVQWPQFDFSVAGFLCFWLICSYVIGRYYDPTEQYPSSAIKQVARTTICLMISISIFSVWLWLRASLSMVATSSGFILPTLIAFSISSCLFQLGLNFAFNKFYISSQLWLVVGSATFGHKLRRALSWSRIQAKLQPINLSNVIFLDFLNLGAKGVVVECFSALSTEEIQVLMHLQAQGLRVLTAVGWSEEVLQRFPPELVQLEDLLRNEFPTPQRSTHKRLKRTADVLISFILLLSTSPLLLLALLVIYFEDGTPVLYSQLRSGLDAKQFRIWKLRTMYLDAEVHGIQWSTKYDPRITRVGKLLRITRIDELPQLLSVLTGEMSLVGPRPERPEIEIELERQIPHYRLRHLIRPGLSGWSQVNYHYGASVEDSENKLSYDLYYLRNASIWLDVLIFFKTIRLVFNARGAIAESVSGQVSR